MNPKVRRHAWLGGYLLVEIDGMPWDFLEISREPRVVVCGELGHAEWAMYQIAWKVSVQRIFEATAVELAHRVGVELP